MNHNELIFWFERPPKVSKGAFNYVTKAWGNKVFYICNNDLKEIRKKAAWDDGNFGHAEVIMLSDSQNAKEKIEEIFKLYPDAIHVIPGFTNKITKLIHPYIRNSKKVVCFSERPGIYGNGIKRFLKRMYIPLSYRYYYFKYRNIISAFLPLGVKGVDINMKFGWKKNQMFPYMYDPNNYAMEDACEIKKTEYPIKMLYVGRFSEYTKGTDVLIKAINLIDSPDWTLDLVGGYGDLKDYTINWANNHSQVSFIGMWPSNEVCTRMKDYDICIIPSKFDGWNLLVNEAIRANIGVIVTDEAVSDELIKASQAGIVVPANQEVALKQALLRAVETPALIDGWKRNAKEYAPRISSESVGNYLIDILEFTFYKKEPRPECPWL
ncbi:MAG: hypothetical protein BGN88_00640 [Clostridiales bacterium 43-6]|nr:MAG: hypothetical protein BGN88_00640 [Clostridiales bacterium 43-6]